MTVTEDLRVRGIVVACGDGAAGFEEVDDVESIRVPSLPGKAEIDPFRLLAELTTLFKRVHSRPPATPRSPDEEAAHAANMKTRLTELSTAFTAYLAGTGAFSSFMEKDSPGRSSFIEIHGENPIRFWEAMQFNAATRERSLACTDRGRGAGGNSEVQGRSYSKEKGERASSPGKQR